MSLAGHTGGGQAGEHGHNRALCEHCGLSRHPSCVTYRLGCPHLINPFSSPRSKQFVSVPIVQTQAPPSLVWCGSEGTMGDHPGGGKLARALGNWRVGVWAPAGTVRGQGPGPVGGGAGPEDSLKTSLM